MRIPFISLAAASAIALGGCAYGGLGYGYGDYGYRDYGYGYGSYGGYYGSPYYGSGYGSRYYGYGGYGGLYGSPYWGWYDNFYYPGSGIYVYDVYRHPHRWSDRQKHYWMGRQQAVRNTGVRTTTVRPNWSGFDRRTSATVSRPTRSERVQERRIQRQTTRSNRARVRPIMRPD
jgi:hypothetical protein